MAGELQRRMKMLQRLVPRMCPSPRGAHPCQDGPAARPPHHDSWLQRSIGSRAVTGTDECRKAEHIRGTRNCRSTLIFRRDR